MAVLADRLVYRLSAVWWNAVYSGLCRSNATRAVRVEATAAFARPPADAGRVLTAA